jgi:pilus assembly protein Flp/PilA
MFKSFRNKKQKGQGMVEYALILVLVAVVVIAALTIMGPMVRSVYQRIMFGMSCGPGKECTLQCTPPQVGLIAPTTTGLAGYGVGAQLFDNNTKVAFCVNP